MAFSEELKDEIESYHFIMQERKRKNHRLGLMINAE